MSLKEHTVKSYDKDLQSIAGTLDNMLYLVIESIEMVAQMIETRDENLIEKINAHDYKINSLDHLIEKKVTAILALRQPMAVDLRYTISSLKVSSNLERSGDQAKSIIKKIARIGREEFEVGVEKSLLAMIDLCKEMVREAVISFNEQNAELADLVMKQDDDIDHIYSDLFRIIEHENFNKEQVKKITNTLFIAKSFERLADHSTNIAEIAKFVVTGEIK
ncbi:MAG: phosphate transport system regulatory protein PhoU [Alphaproteobacteria bacterium RIFCSPLOWO2_01_FULL_40_26]|nr:MAG: phosphate transport system regulatory protein PhoU [Alphaproteobacteria bacterium RIFCSPHIGHO2_02_FULL_40_34]OFW88297.1 MAG: phosphate transport system regulatory protein PhoU [Alphaproteobacteria bacterium RIFCSPHIGHO2_01_FULL_40_8]OFW94263.1 MAG: phosphate transport system regulatory protein PhoU [Alphaproteobacteria bacterium RIFCSPLOWO2_01_FULL_40_26]OFX09832.1 MAG: phosphate transport system regulatory protein PhoU [Alphaproteobacteria bacterium RIFCSPLOWO2_02_FULL_40_19]OFX11415.1